MWELVIQFSPFDSAYTTQYYTAQVFPLPGNSHIPVHLLGTFDTSQYLLMASVKVWIANFGSWK